MRPGTGRIEVRTERLHPAPAVLRTCGNNDIMT
jgi:hypothetical protein